MDDAKPPIDSWASHPHLVGDGAFHRQLDGVWQTWHPYNGWEQSTPTVLKMLMKAGDESALDARCFVWRSSDRTRRNAHGGRAREWSAHKTVGGPLWLGWAWAWKPGEWRFEAWVDDGLEPGVATSKFDAALKLLDAGERHLAAKLQEPAEGEA